MACMLIGTCDGRESGQPVIVSAMPLYGAMGSVPDQMRVAYFLDLCTTHTRKMYCLDLLR